MYTLYNVLKGDDIISKLNKEQTKTQMAANRADYERNKDERKKSAYRRQARLFVRNYAEQDDIQELKTLIQNREKQLEIGND